MHDGSSTNETDARRAPPQRGADVKTARIADRRPNAVDGVVGLRLREIREARRLSREAVAGGLGVSWQQVQKYEAGTSRLTAGHLYRLSQLLGCPVADFFAGIDPALVADAYGPEAA